MTISDSEILNLWKDKTFSGSFSGIHNFQVLLKTDKGIEVSQSRLLKVLKTDPIYLIHKKRKRNFERRHYDVNFYGQLVQIDIAYMFPDGESNYKYFLLAIDAFSSKIFTKVLKDKTTGSVSSALKEIFKEFGAPIYEIQSDQGKEFVGKETKALFDSFHILYRSKYGKNKASFAEFGILLVKRKLYMLMRSEMTHNWASNLQTVCKNLNNTPLKKLGWLTPNSVNNESDSVKVRNARSDNKIFVPQEPTYEEQFQNQDSYKGDLHVGDYVYLDFDEKLMDKSFDVSVRF